jgi:hypothetical protein
VGEKVCHEEVVLDGEALDPPPPLTLLLHKPVGYVVTSPDDQRISDPKIYDLLPYRYGTQNPYGVQDGLLHDQRPCISCAQLVPLILTLCTHPKAVWISRS